MSRRQQEKKDKFYSIVRIVCVHVHVCVILFILTVQSTREDTEYFTSS